MSIIAILLIVTSAVLHAGWNLVSKRQSPSLAFFFVASAAGTIIATPIFYIYRHSLPQIPLVLWGIIMATGSAQAVYLLGLAGAYKRGDLSVAYPLARALPVLFVAFVTLLLGKRAEITNAGLVGMGLISAGCIILPLHHFGKLRLRNYLNIVCLMALIAAIGTTGYTLIDDFLLRQLRPLLTERLTTNEVTLLFVALQMGSTVFMVGLGVLILPSERRAFVALVQNHSVLATSFLTGVIITTAYGLVLASMAYVTNVSYVAAFRQLSIPLGAILGLTLQKEPPYRPKLVGIAIVSVGLFLVAVN